MWANPTLARRDGGWSWLSWHGDRAEECWAATSEPLEAAIESARTGTSYAELCRLHDEDLVTALIEAGVLARPMPLGEPVAAAGASGDYHTDLLATFARDHGDTEVALLDVLEAPVGRGPLLDGVTITPSDAPSDPSSSCAANAIDADIVVPGGPPPTTAHAIALARVESITGVTWLALADLRVSIVEDRLVLRSASLDRCIIPHTTRAVSPSDPGVLRLLAALGGVGVSRFPDRGIAAAFPLGGEWLEVKLYTTRRRADRVIVELADLVRGIPAIDHWHFLRYADPRWHVRARFHGPPRALVRDVLPRLCEAAADWLDGGLIGDLQTGTYRREIARYGGADGVRVVERMFAADSECVAALCRLLSQDDGEDARWQIAALGMQQLVADVVAPADAQAVYTAMRDDFVHRLGRVELPSTLAFPTDLAEARAVLSARSAAIAPLADELHALERAGRLSRSVTAIAASLVHMFANRLLRAFALEQELVLYELLCRAAR
jgi:thiopeptide-type bacteriocin biosynthesis protein